MPSKMARRQLMFPVSPGGEVAEAALEHLSVTIRRHARRLAQEGFIQQFVLVRPPGDVRPPHAHYFDSEVHVLRGELTVRRRDREDVLTEGQNCRVAAGEEHEERTGRNGATLLVGCS